MKQITSRLVLPSVVAELLLLLMVMGITMADATEATRECVASNAVTLYLRHHTNETGHTILNGRLEDSRGSTWQMEVDLRTFAYGAGQPQCKVFSFEVTDTSLKKQVPPGYTLREGFGYFRLGTHALNWTDARDACAREGAHLAFANSQEEALMYKRDFDFNVLGTSVKNLLWYGASDIAQEGKFITSTGLALERTGYASFLSGRPNGGIGENCIYITDSVILLDDGVCGVTLAYICKVSL